MKKVYAIKLSDGTYFIKTIGHCGWEADWSITRRTATFPTLEKCELEILNIKQQFNSFNGKPCLVWGV